MFKAILIGFFTVPLFYTPCVFSQEDKGAVIIKNEVSSSTETSKHYSPGFGSIQMRQNFVMFVKKKKLRQKIFL